MKKATIYFNPACSKSRAALQLLEQNGIDATVIEYLNEPPTVEQLRRWVERLETNPLDLVRTHEEEWQQLLKHNINPTDEQVFEALVKYPLLLQRPIVCIEDRMIIARPAEKLLSLI